MYKKTTYYIFLPRFWLVIIRWNNLHQLCMYAVLLYRYFWSCSRLIATPSLARTLSSPQICQNCHHSGVRRLLATTPTVRSTSLQPSSQGGSSKRNLSFWSFLFGGGLSSPKREMSCTREIEALWTKAKSNPRQMTDEEWQVILTPEQVQIICFLFFTSRKATHVILLEGSLRWPLTTMTSGHWPLN